MNIELEEKDNDLDFNEVEEENRSIDEVYWKILVGFIGIGIWFNGLFALYYLVITLLFGGSVSVFG